jgi:hypothetical protein
VNLGLGLSVLGISELRSGLMNLANLANLRLGLSVLGDQSIEWDAFRPLW